MISGSFICLGLSLRPLETTHEARTDFDMLLGSLYLLIVGAGAWSLDAMLTGKRWVVIPSQG